MCRAILPISLLSLVLFSTYFLGPNPALATTISDICGDANNDQSANVGDAIYLVNYVFNGGPAPDPLEIGDANQDGAVNVGDIIWIINYVFKGGPAPCQAMFELAGFCTDGVPLVEIINNGPDMSSSQTYSVLYENGNSDSGDFHLLDNEIDTIGLSNMYGSCSVTLDASGKILDMENCLTPYFDDFMAGFDFNAIMPQPATQDPSFCQYEYYFLNIDYDSTTSVLTPISGGMNLHSTYHHLTGDIEMHTNNTFCFYVDGTLTIDSVLVDVDMSFTEASEKVINVVFGNPAVTYENFSVNIPPAFDAFVEYIIFYWYNIYMYDLEVQMAAQLQGSLVPMLEGMLVP